MKTYYKFPFSFDRLIKSDKKDVEKISLDESIRNNIQYLILTKVGDFAYDKKLGFEMWDYDKMVFYHEKEPYFKDKRSDFSSIGLLENSNAKKSFSDNLKDLIINNEVRIQDVDVDFTFEKVDGQLSVYQRLIKIKIDGRIKSTGLPLSPGFLMQIFFTPFKIETN